MVYRVEGCTNIFNVFPMNGRIDYWVSSLLCSLSRKKKGRQNPDVKCSCHDFFLVHCIEPNCACTLLLELDDIQVFDVRANFHELSILESSTMHR